MKVLLINPPDWDQVVYSSNEAAASERGYYPPLGLMYIASMLKKEGGHEVAIIDAVLERLRYDRLGEILRRDRPDMVGITAFTMNVLDALETARCVKRNLPGAHVCMGGPHVTLFPLETLGFESVDTVVVGDGEFTCLRLVQALEGGESLQGIPGLLYKDNGKAVGNPPAARIKDLDRIPHPARELTRYREYWSILGDARPATTMMTTRGCPFQCVFCCHDPVFRLRSISNVMEEVSQCVSLGIKEIFFFDETFNIDRRRVLQFCREMTALGSPVAFDIRARVDTVDPEILRSLKESGCRRIQFGVEAGTQKVLDRIGKRITLKQAEDAFLWARRAGLITFADFMVGLPGETADDIHRTIAFAKKLEPDYVQFSSLLPLPGTDIYEEGIRTGIFSGDFWRDYARNPKAGFIPELWTEFLSAEQIHQLCNRANVEFYFRPLYIVTQILRTRSVRNFLLHAKLGLRLFRNYFAQRVTPVRMAEKQTHRGKLNAPRGSP